MYNKKVGIKFPPELYDGNIEYKQQLLGINNTKIDRYTTQLNYRLNEGDGLAIYIIGVHDKGYILGLDENRMIDSIIKIKYVINKLQQNISYKFSILYNEFLNKYISIVYIKNNCFIKNLHYIS
jgi:GTPase